MTTNETVDDEEKKKAHIQVYRYTTARIRMVCIENMDRRQATYLKFLTIIANILLVVPASASSALDR